MRLWQRLCLLALCAQLIACGGPGQGSEQRAGLSSSPADCSLEAQRLWLEAWMRDWYFWYQSVPAVPMQSPGVLGPQDAMRAHFKSMLFQGSDNLPADRWSFVEDSERYQQYYGVGMNLGFGLSVAGQAEDPLPLRIRWVEPRSAAGAAGLQRGDIIVSMQSRPAQFWKQTNDFSVLLANTVGDRLELEVLTDLGTRRVELVASLYPVTSVFVPAVESTWLGSDGRRAGYVFLKDFIDASMEPLGRALDELASRGIRDLILDLRYHGGGRLDLATRLASSFAPQSLRGEVFAELVYNDKHAGAIQVERFGDPAPLPKLELDRLVVLTGPRTCSASEVLINGLKSRSASLQVVSVGGKTCGKPFGFHPADACGLQYHAVNFMVRNARGQASELDGMTPDCVAGDDYQTPLGRAGDPLVESARYWLSYGRCPTPVQSQAATPRKSAAQTLGVQDGDAPRAMYR